MSDNKGFTSSMNNQQQKQVSNDSDKKLNLTAPWWITYNKIKAIFSQDDELEVGDLKSDNAKHYVTISSANKSKLESLSEIIKDEFKFGDNSLIIQYFYTGEDTITASTIEQAFKGNKLFVELYDAGDFIYPIFKKEVIQFYEDTLSDAYGNYNAVVADAIKDLLIEGSIIYPSTDSDKKEFNNK